MNFLCKLLLWSGVCCLLANRVQAQEDGQGQRALNHHPPKDQLPHEKYYSTWHMHPAGIPLARWPGSHLALTGF